MDNSTKLTVIGMDPPVSVNCGWSVVSLENNKAFLYEKFTQVLDKAKGDLNLQAVYDQFNELIEKYKPKALCMERQLGGGFQFGRAKLNEFVGVVKLCAIRNNLKVVEVSPAHLKMVIAGHGKAPKECIMDNVAKTFGLNDAGAEHECDAAAFGLTYFIDNGWQDYQIKTIYTKEMAKAEADAKKERKRLREERKKAKELGLPLPKTSSRKNAKV